MLRITNFRYNVDNLSEIVKPVLFNTYFWHCLLSIF